ncbi:MAG: hypothetical protein HQL63_04390 [Magnetococcales bacterium]|nr:hypothetical protein [Magnetococcales bacterium]MBF0321745.1 hypothetical protein [Magnetococcales bacterium]
MAVFLIAGTIIALQITIMRLYAISGWAHFGSLVVSVAMFGFGLASTIMCLGREAFEHRIELIARLALLLFGPVMVLGNVVAQSAQFNPIFLLADVQQAFNLAINLFAYAAPFLLGAILLGICFLVGRNRFQLTYAADMTGSGITGLLCLAAMHLLLPEHLLLLPLLLWWGGALAWFHAWGDRRAPWLVSLSGVVALLLLFLLPQIQVSPYKGVSYATKFPDAKRLYQAAGAHGLLEIYGSSYFHFAPGLSDMASLSMGKLPENAYVGMYVDSDGPIGIMKALPREQADYDRFLPMFIPYLLKPQPERVFVVQFGGGISTRVALAEGAKHVVVAEGNPMIPKAFASEAIRSFTDNFLADPRLTLAPVDGHLFMRTNKQRFQVIDLSLADSTGLSSPGGFAVTEKFLYTREAMTAYMDALEPGGVLAVTVWNKEDPPKSTLRLFSTMAEAGRATAHELAADSFYVLQVFLSTTTVLYKRGGFSPEELAKLDDHAREMAFDVVYRPGERFQGDARALLAGYREVVLGRGGKTTNASDTEEPTSDEEGVDLSVPSLYRLMLSRMMHNENLEEIRSYPFDVSPLTNDRPYFAGSVRLMDLPAFAGRLEVISDEWGYLLLWLTLGQSILAGALLLSLPILFGWRTLFSPHPGKLGTLGYFAAVGLGYILVEVALIGKFISALGNQVISTSVLITGMLISTGLGSMVSGRYEAQAATVMPRIFLAIAAILGLYGFALESWLAMIGTLSWRTVACILLLFPPAFLMGFPFATAMTCLTRLGKEPFFLWAWGINGMFSVIGAVLVPLIAVSVGLSANLYLAGALYLLAWPCFVDLSRPSVASATSCGSGRS